MRARKSGVRGAWGDGTVGDGTVESEIVTGMGKTRERWQRGWAR